MFGTPPRSQVCKKVHKLSKNAFLIKHRKSILGVLVGVLGVLVSVFGVLVGVNVSICVFIPSPLIFQLKWLFDMDDF